ncbi:MAG: hypothetical protein IH586_13955 [Anaerolineaceae bacterium]|nr:hypothetical protein [Anaerolineaceae bacterium]
MENEAIIQEIDALIATIGEDTTVAKPAAERAVLAHIRQLLESTREQRVDSARGLWETYLPYAARLCLQLSKQEEGWADELEYFASENSQYWIDSSGALLENGDIGGVSQALGKILEATRMMKQDMIARVDILLQAIEIALEISDKKQSILLYEEAEKLYRKHLAGGSAYTGSAWLRKIKKMGQQLARCQEKLRRYFAHSATVAFAIEAATAEDLERVIETLEINLPGKVKITRRAKEADGQGQSGAGRFRARLKITLDP